RARWSARHGGRIHRPQRVAAWQLAEWGDRGAREHSRHRSSPHPPRHAGLRRCDRMDLRWAPARRDGTPGDRMMRPGPSLRTFVIGLGVVGLGVVGLVVATGAVTAAGSSTEPGPQAGLVSGSADCGSVATCYTPRQLEVAYGVQPLLQRGIDGRGETVVLPELAESQLSPPRVTDLRLDFAAFDRVFHLPVPRLKVVSTFRDPAHPWFAFGEEVLDAEVVHAM